MGLDCSHDAFHGAYSAFNRFRQIIAKVMGGSFPPHEDPELEANAWYWEGDDYSKETHPGLYAFMMHSDCDGDMSPRICKCVADEMEVLLPEIEKHGMGGGHIEAAGGYKAVAERFIAGCRAAHEANEPLEFC